MTNLGGMYKLPVAGRVSKPASCNEILPRLYLGDICIATNKEEITRLGITDMITIEIRPLDASYLAQTVKRYLYINVMDHSKQDILSHFEASNEFIESALKTPSNKVYVHCVAGVSRSASLVIAYIMKTRSMDYTEAHSLVQQKRKVIDPNEGFVRQLTLYHKMKYSIDIANIEYRRLVLDALVFEFRLVYLSYYQIHSQKVSSSGSSSMIHMPLHGHKNLAEKNNIIIIFDQYYNKLNLQQVNKFPQIYDPESAIKCNKCRAIVFYAISVIENKQGGCGVTKTNTPQGLESTGSSSSASKLQSESKSSKDQVKDCPFIFIEPQPWMSKIVSERDGNLECYKCKRKLGKFDWTSGESCSCPKHNSHINFNLFKIMKKKVDFPGPGYMHTS